jgi:hypothetical protein
MEAEVFFFPKRDLFGKNMMLDPGRYDGLLCRWGFSRLISVSIDGNYAKCWYGYRQYYHRYRQKLKSRTSNRETVRDVLVIRSILPYTIYVVWGLLVRALSRAWGCFWEVISNKPVVIMSWNHQFHAQVKGRGKWRGTSLCLRPLFQFSIRVGLAENWNSGIRHREVPQWLWSRVALHVTHIRKAPGSYLAQKTDCPDYTPQSSSVPSGI